jgi:hypothetical protein
VGIENEFGSTRANLGPRNLLTTGQLHEGGPVSVVGLQIIQRPRISPQEIEGRVYSFHDLDMAQAIDDYRTMAAARRPVFQIMVEGPTETGSVLGLVS